MGVELEDFESKTEFLTSNNLEKHIWFASIGFLHQCECCFKSGWLAIPNEKVSVCVELYGNYGIIYGFNYLLWWIIIMCNCYD